VIKTENAAVAITLETTIVQSSDCLFADVADEAVIMSVERGVYVGLNPIGKKVWSELAVPRRVDALCATLESAHDAPAETIRADVLAFLSRMLDAGMVVAS
jgi:hypothetical protein